MPSMPDLFHVSQQRFDHPSREEGIAALLRDGEAQGKHPKGALGLWLSPSPESCDGFGAHTARPVFTPGTVFAVMEIGHLRKIAADVDDLSFQEQVRGMSRLGVALSEYCDVLLIEDASDQVGEVIMLNEACLASWDWMDTRAAIEQARGQDRSWSAAIAVIDVDACRAVAGWRLDAAGEPVRVKAQGVRP